MLYSMDSLSQIDWIPHEDDYGRRRDRLSDEEYDAIVAELNR